MNFSEWIVANTHIYRGYTVIGGTIYKGGEPVVFFQTKLGEEHAAENLAEAKRIIDELEDHK